jgi:hypothetical protein
MNKETLRMQMLAGIITEGQYKAKLNENMENWGNEEDDYGNSEENYRTKPSLADFENDEEAYKKYMEENFPGEPLDLNESSRLYREGDNIFNIIDQEIIIPDQDSNYANGTTQDEDETNYGIGFSTQKLEKDYTDEQKQNFINYLKKRAEEGNEKAKKLYQIAQTSPEAKEFI